MHGIIRPVHQSELHKNRFWERLKEAIHSFRWFLLLVILPTLVTAGYYFLIASNQYEAGADFVVRRSESTVKGGVGIGQVLGFSFGTSQSQSEAFLVEEYLLSQNTVEKLRKDEGLVQRFLRPGIDFLSRPWSDNPTPETLLTYYRNHVSISQDSETGITHLRVHAFTPRDAYQLSEVLLQMGEQRINELNQRNYTDQISSAREELVASQNELADAQRNLTLFRQTEADVDPGASSKAQIGLVTGISAQLAGARAQLESMGKFLAKSSPQYRALAAQVRALEAQVAGQNARLAGSTNSIAKNLGDYEDLVIRKEFAAQRYTAAAAGFEQAKAEAIKKQLYLTRVVEPSLPVKSEYPKRTKAVATVFFSLLMAYAIGWLLVSGVKEHAM